MTDVYVAGVSMTQFGKLADRSVADLAREALADVVADAGCGIDAIDAAFFSNTTQSIMEGQHLVPGEMALRRLGLGGIPMSNVENACASASTALHHAAMAVRAGEAEIALAIGVDKMYGEDRARSFEVFNGAWDVHDVAGTLARIREMGAGLEVPDSEDPEAARRPASPFMEVYANWGKFHMKTFGTTRDQIAAVAEKNHRHSADNAKSQYRDTPSIAEILAARQIAWPLTLPMCAPISDGAAAAVVCSKAGLARLAADRAVKLHACVLGTGEDRAPEDLDRHLSRLAALKAYDRAGFGPDDMSLAEVHDATAVGEIMQCEFLGFCDFGEGGHMAERGETSLGGRLPVNPSGGLESKGHPIGATGLGQVYELVTQLRGEAGSRQVPDARLAIAENGGGIYGIEESVTCVTILGR